MNRAWDIVWSAYVLALVAFSLLPAAMPQGMANDDKLMHFLAYAILVALCPWRRRYGRGPWAVSWAMALGVVLEVGQDVLPTGRVMDVRDMVANALGAISGAGLKWSVEAWRPRIKVASTGGAR